MGEYAIHPLAELIEKTTLLKKKLGGDRLKEAVTFLEASNTSAWVEMMMQYYDNNYDRNNEIRGAENINSLDLEGEKSLETIAKKLLLKASEI